MIDRLQRFPNQVSDRRFTECTAETVCDILGNFYNQPFDPGFTYGATHFLQGTSPEYEGADPVTAMQSAVVFGCLPTEKEPFDATTTSQEHEADFSQYDWTIRGLAQYYPANGIKHLYTYQDIVNYLNTSKMGVCLGMSWYSSFMMPNADGTLPAPYGTMSNHCVAIYGVDKRGLQIKPWLGKDYGEGGYCYLSPVMFPQVGTVAIGFDMQSWRWASIVSIMLQFPYTIRETLPLLSKLK